MITFDILESTYHRSLFVRAFVERSLIQPVQVTDDVLDVLLEIRTLIKVLAYENYSLSIEKLLKDLGVLSDTLSQSQVEGGYSADSNVLDMVDSALKLIEKRMDEQAEKEGLIL